MRSTTSRTSTPRSCEMCGIHDADSAVAAALADLLHIGVSRGDACTPMFEWVANLLACAEGGAPMLQELHDLPGIDVEPSAERVTGAANRAKVRDDASQRAL